MKRYAVISLLTICFIGLTACGASSAPPDSGAIEEPVSVGKDRQREEPQGVSGAGDGFGVVGDAGAGDDSGNAEKKGGELPGESEVMRLRIVDGAESGSLVLAGARAGEVYVLNVDGDSPIAVFLDGQPADASVLEDGMMAEISFDGTILESYPGQFGQVYSISVYSLGTEQNPGGTYYDLCGLYLQVLEDLWNRDKGLNSDISCISVDLSQEPGGLTPGEREAVAWIFGCGHQVEALSFTSEELAEQGYLTEVMPGSGNGLYQWEDGVLFCIAPPEEEDGGAYSLPVLKFNASKWRSPTGAYFLTDCTAVWPQMGSWDGYEIGGEAIS